MELEVKIPERNLGNLERKINKLNKRAAKLGCPPIILEDTGQIVQVATGEWDIFDKPITIKSHIMKIYGEAPKLNGWSFIGTIEHSTDGNILRSIPDEEMPAGYRTAEKRCDHCNKIRTRINTYVVRNDDGEYKQVGRQCLKDFLGHQSPQAIARHAEWLMDLSASIGEYDSEAVEEIAKDIEGRMGSIVADMQKDGIAVAIQAGHNGSGSPIYEI